MPTLINKASFWVVVADEFQVRVYAKDLRKDPLQDLFSLENPVAREKMENLISDRGGRSFDSHGEGRHTLAGEKSDAKKQASLAFAKQLAEHISGAINKGTCRSFALIAAPRFLGVLRDALATVGNATPVVSIDKEVVNKDTAFIEKLLAGHYKG